MNLFDSIGLSADPFSTSPNVDLFYPAVEHRQCLEGLELSIRMRRGLSVIRGGIGVGKTTISRKLIQNFKDESDDFDFYLILDPKFESEIILLKHIIELFGINESAESVQNCRNIIENYLLRVGVEQGKTLVLVIDEGQNLPGEMLDVFRTLLNFETDDYKLLQLILFGQPEMGKIIHKYPNFEDRIAFDFEIGPITLEDMQGMIDHRIQITGGKAGSWFNQKSIQKIHKNTQGYPRKVTQLCHQLLLTMISEEKKEINEEMVQRVISGKIDTGGLLKQKKKNYNEIAVNKLLDVLRKDTPEPKLEDQKTISNDIEEDEWIGGNTEDSKEQVIEKIEHNIQEAPVDTINLQKVEQSTSPLKEKKQLIEPNVIESEVLTNNEPTVTFIDEKDFLPTQGRIPSHISPSILSKIPIDKTFTGVHIDSGKVFSVIIDEKNGIKTLLAYNQFSSKNRKLNHSENPEDYSEACQESITQLIENLSEYSDLYNIALKAVSKRNTIALTSENKKILLKLVDIPKENQKDKQQIVEWTVKKDLNFSLEESTLNYTPGKSKTNYYVGIGENDTLDEVTTPLGTIGWEIRSLYPVAQAVYNSFIWNYPEHKKKSTLIINLGENHSTLLGCVKLELKVIKPLYIGVQSLTDSMRDNAIPTENWHERGSFQVPEPFLRAMGKKIAAGEHDNIFRSVFDSWRQEIDRTINGIRKDFKITEDTTVLLSGSAGEILYLDTFIEGSIGLSTSFLNPMRNLNVPPNFDPKSLKYNPSILTGAIGSALQINPSVNILPNNIKQRETLRWVNRAGMLATAGLFIFGLLITLNTKLSINAMQTEILPMQAENDQLSYVEEDHSSLVQNKTNVKEQLGILSYDTEYFNRILAINKFLSYYTPNEIKISTLNFQDGWEIEAYKKIGRDLVKVVRKEDEHLRIVRIEGKVEANAALLTSHFDQFIDNLEESGLFQNIEIMNQSSKSYLGKNSLQFDLKCVI